MPKCGSCNGEIADNNRFCPTCGRPVDADVFSTRTVAASSPVTPRSSSGTPSSAGSRVSSSTSSTRGESRFVPGTLLADRYRIVSILGKGGMGEVYRADDLTLDQPVA